MLPSGALRDYGNPGVTGAVGGVALFLEDAEEVVAVIFPSTIYVYGVLRWQGSMSCGSVSMGLGGSCMRGLWRELSGALAGVI